MGLMGFKKTFCEQKIALMREVGVHAVQPVSSLEGKAKRSIEINRGIPHTALVNVTSQQPTLLFQSPSYFPSTNFFNHPFPTACVLLPFYIPLI